MAHDVFISYSSDDEPVADRICHGLEERGVRCWITPRDVGYGRRRLADGDHGRPGRGQGASAYPFHG